MSVHHTDKQTDRHTYICIYRCVCVCVCFIRSLLLLLLLLHFFFLLSLSLISVVITYCSSTGSFDQYESLLEPILVSYVEHLVKVEDVEELFVEESSEKLTYTLGLLELLVPTMRHPNILLSVGKLLALTHGATHHYTHRQVSTT